MSKSELYNKTISNIKILERISKKSKDVEATKLAFNMVHTLLGKNELEEMKKISDMLELRISTLYRYGE